MAILESFISVIMLYDRAFEYDDDVFELLRCMQNLRQSTCGHGVLYADRS
jgi:hypothetical protein